ncbi:hypothetical protein HY256_10870 [Candidatus Sumerlaeota bacterium]|nr:hypothetical protein [Candidatus Sumerlaeota bacterium]
MTSGNPITHNILIQRDWRAVKADWLRRPFVWLVLLIGAVQFFVCLNWEAILGSSPRDPDDLIWYFTAFHLFIHFVVPLGALRLVREPRLRGKLDELRPTPIPQNHIFWWLWMKVFVPAIVVLLVLYFPLYIPFPWLHLVSISLFDDPEPKLYSGYWPVCFPIALMMEGAGVGLFFLPWIKRKSDRWLLWLIAILLLGCWAMFSLHAESWVRSAIAAWLGDGVDDAEVFWLLQPLHTHIHPLITLSYFMISIGWGAALGIYLGLSPSRSSAQSLWLLLLFGPLSEWGVYHLFALEYAFGGSGDPGPWGLYNILGANYLMLIFYMLGTGSLWMGIKWNLMIWLSRKRIEAD